MSNAPVQSGDEIRVTGPCVSGAKVHGDVLTVTGMVDTICPDERVFKVWPDDPNSGDGGGKLWFRWDGNTELTILSRNGP